MTSLFENFDLMNNYYLSLNWIILFIPMIMFYNYWLIPSRYSILYIKLLNSINLQFINLIPKREMNIPIFLNLLLFLFMLNFMGLMPYIYTITSQMSMNLSISLPIWIGIMIFMIMNNLDKFLIHLTPLNTPSFLMNFMVLIELISNIIRPLTLAIRLTANIVAGHLLMNLLGNFMNSMNLFIMMIMLMIQNLFLILEISMSFIQAYVFSMLMLLYYSETINE